MAKENHENRENRDKRNGDRRGGFREVEKEFREELLEVARVTRVTAGGRQLRFRAAVVVGNGKGTVGLGVGKAAEVVVAIEKAVRDAKKNLITFPIQSGTIPHDVTANYKATSVLLHPASEGTGLIAGGAIRKLMSVSGLKDIIAKRFGGTNQLTNTQAAIRALASLKAKSAFQPTGKKVVASEAAPKAAEGAVEVPKEEKKAPAKKPTAPKADKEAAPAKKPAAKKAPAKKSAE